MRTVTATPHITQLTKLPDDGLPYSVLAYANGPGGATELPRTVGWDEG